MKKLLSTLCAFMLLCSLCLSAVPAFAEEEEDIAIQSSWIKSLGWTPAAFDQNDFSRAVCVVLSMLDAASNCGLDIESIDLTVPSYFGLDEEGMYTDVYFGSVNGGYYNLTWWEFNNRIYLYHFESCTGYDDIVAAEANQGTTYTLVPDEAIDKVFETLSTNEGEE